MNNMMLFLLLAPLFARSTAQLQNLEFQQINPLIKGYIDNSVAASWSQRLHHAANTINDPSCSDPNDKWIIERIREIGYGRFRWLKDNHVLELAFTYKVFIDQNQEDEYFGKNGQHTKELLERHQKSANFWERTDINGTLDTDDILLLGMHGRDLEEDKNLIPTLMLFFNNSYETAQNNADIIQKVISGIPGGFNNPLLTCNAIAVKGGLVPEYGMMIVPDSIIIGDGILDYLDYAGLGNDGPDFMHAHEYGHHMQYEADIDHKGYLSDSEENRRIEMMADAFSGYFLAHDLGGDMSIDQIKQLHETAFHTGDCKVDSEDHHGTPLQRECATIWGANQAAIFSDIVLSPGELRSLFDADLEDILNFDKETCILMETIPEGEADIEKPKKELTSVSPVNESETINPKNDAMNINPKVRSDTINPKSSAFSLPFHAYSLVIIVSVGSFLIL